MKKISISVTDEEYKLIKLEADSKGLSVSDYSRVGIFNYVATRPVRGAMKEMYLEKQKLEDSK